MFTKSTPLKIDRCARRLRFYIYKKLLYYFYRPIKPVQNRFLNIVLLAFFPKFPNSLRFNFRYVFSLITFVKKRYSSKLWDHKLKSFYICFLRHCSDSNSVSPLFDLRQVEVLKTVILFSFSL